MGASKWGHRAFSVSTAHAHSCTAQARTFVTVVTRRQALQPQACTSPSLSLVQVQASPLEIRSSPSCNLLIEPDGTVNLTSAHEQIFSSAYTFVGAAFPQTAVLAGCQKWSMPSP